MVLESDLTRKRGIEHVSRAVQSRDTTSQIGPRQTSRPQRMASHKPPRPKHPSSASSRPLIAGTPSSPLASPWGCTVSRLSPRAAYVSRLVRDGWGVTSSPLSGRRLQVGCFNRFLLAVVGTNIAGYARCCTCGHLRAVRGTFLQRSPSSRHGGHAR